MRPLAIAAAIALSLAAAARAESVTLGPATFEVPTGWKVIKKSATSLTLQSPEAEVRERGSILLMLSNSPAARADAAFAEFARGVSNKQYKPDRVVVARTPGGYAARKVECDYEIEKDGREIDVNVKAVGVQSSMQLVCAALLTFSTAAEYAHDEPFEAMVRVMKMTGGPVVKSPPPTTADVEGLFGKFGITNQLNPMGGMDLVQTRDYLLFLPGGLLYRDVPPADAIAATGKPDPALLRKLRPQYCGGYSIGGGKITVTDADAYGFLTDETHDWKGVADDGGVTVDDAYLRLGPEKNRKLDGTYRSFNYSGGNGTMGGVSGGVVSERFLTLRPDGTYEQEGFVGVSMTVESGDARTGISGGNKKGKEAGKYMLDGYTLTLTPAKGTPQKLSAYVTGDDAGMLVVNDTPYLKRDGK